MVSDGETVPDVPVTRAISDGSLERMLPKEMRGKGIVPCDGLNDMQRGQIANWIAPIGLHSRSCGHTSEQDRTIFSKGTDEMEIQGKQQLPSSIYRVSGNGLLM